MQRAQPPEGARRDICARIDRDAAPDVFPARSEIRSRAPVSASSASTSDFTSKKSILVASLPHCSGNAEPVATPAITSVSRVGVAVTATDFEQTNARLLTPLIAAQRLKQTGPQRQSHHRRARQRSHWQVQTPARDTAALAPPVR